MKIQSASLYSEPILMNVEVSIVEFVPQFELEFTRLIGEMHQYWDRFRKGKWVGASAPSAAEWHLR